MIPTQLSPVDREIMVLNITRKFRSATEVQLSAGRDWYPSAHLLALMIADGDAVTGAGVIAALSANKSWPENKRLARIALETGEPRGHVGDALRKAGLILSGVHPSEVLPMQSKTGQFFRCIADPTDAEAVCVDRHAHDVAVGRVYGNADRGLSSVSRYSALADAYRVAAEELGELPQTVQAVTWVVQIESKSGV